jgi:N6-L-threonylcarbamoyladenine synthase
MVTQTSRKKTSPLPPACELDILVYSPRANITAGRLLCLGIEGSANKLGAGIISHSPSPSSSKTTVVTVLSNVRHTYITPPGEGFLPSDTARHHREWVVKVIKECVKKAGVRMEDLDCIAFTKGTTSATNIYVRLIIRTGYGYTTTSRSSGREDIIAALQHPTSRSEPLCWS